MAVAVKKIRDASADSRLQLWSAIETGNCNQLEEILASGPAINLKDKDGVTPLLHAACHGRVEVIRTLIERGADVNAVRVDGFTPLLLAIFFGHADVVRVLMESGADVTATTRFNTSAQMWATARGFHDLSEYLQQQEAQSPVVVADAFLKNPIVVPEVLVATKVVVDHVQQATTPTEPRVNGSTETRDGAGRNVIREPVGVRTLKDPPEIWDLVHENRTHFNPRATFVSRILSMRPRTAALMATILIAMISVPAVIKWKGRAARSATVTPVVLGATSNANGETPPEVKSVTESTSQAPTSTSSENNSVPAPESRDLPPVASGSQGNELVGAHSRVSSAQRFTRSARPPGSESGERASNTSSGGEETEDTRQRKQATPPVESNSNTNTRLTRDPAAANKASVVTTNSHLIDRPSGSPTPKPKVIQWP